LDLEGVIHEFLEDPRFTFLYPEVDYMRLISILIQHKYYIKPHYWPRIREQIKWLSEHYSLFKENVYFIWPHFGNKEELQNIQTEKDFFQWVNKYYYSEFDCNEDVLMFCWSPKILNYLLKKNVGLNENFLFITCKDNYCIINWLYYHYENKRMTKEELIHMMIKINIIYLNHLYDYNIKYPNKPYYDWLYVYDNEIDFYVYIYLLFHLKEFNPNIVFQKYVASFLLKDLFYYYTENRSFDWSLVQTDDWIRVYPNMDVLDTEFNHRVLMSEIECYKEYDKEEIITKMLEYCRDPELNFEIANHYVSINNLKKAIYYGLKAKEYKFVNNLIHDFKGPYENFDNIQSDFDYLYYLLSLKVE
jgi:hypothetical protein